MWLLGLIVVAAFLTTTVTGTSHKDCEYQDQVCSCDPDADVCHFQLEIEELQTFTSYKLVPSETGRLILGVGGYSYFFNRTTGYLVPSGSEPKENPDKCIIYEEKFKENNCTKPMTVDSRTYNTFIATNGLIPGPTLIVHYNQTVVIDVKNRLVSEGLSIHWHGMHQMNTPWMDGIAHITQCPITPGATFRYIFKATPTGTFWYHSHVGVQRTEGQFGSLIVKETEESMAEAESLLQQELNGNFTVEDKPEEHTLSMLDWQQEDFLSLSMQLHNDIPFFPGTLDGELPRLLQPFVAPLASDGTIVSRVPYWSGIINGLGRHENITYNESRLSSFHVSYWNESNPVYYRFRLVGAQNGYLYRVSISDHKLIVIGIDGYLTRPMEVDYLFVHTGERYDFLLKPKGDEEAAQENYLILLETEGGRSRGKHVAEAILSYAPDPPPSTEYENIVMNSPNRTCSDSSMCTALNCPFEEYDEDRYIDCIPLTNMSLLFPTPDNELPPDPTEELFFNFGVQGESGNFAINGRNLLLPHGSLQTQQGQEYMEKVCMLGNTDCSEPQECVCTHIHNLTTYNTSVQFVLSIVGKGSLFAHPVHLHGHSFHVAGIFYGNYNDNETLVLPNGDITCQGNPRCTDPTWNGTGPIGTVTDRTIRKDTIIIPPGGYVLIRFLSDNPGYWFMHCHIEPHLLDGMAVVINELNSLQNPPPAELAKLQCGNFDWTVDEFEDKLNFDPLERTPESKDGGAESLVVTFWVLALLIPLVLLETF